VEVRIKGRGMAMREGKLAASNASRYPRPRWSSRGTMVKVSVNDASANT
jgi:hypothetical protein